MTIAQIFKLLLVGSVVLSVFAIALTADRRDVLYLFREWRRGLRALVAIFVVVPAVVIAMAYWLPLDPYVKLAMIALSLSPIPPLLPKKQAKAGGSGSYIVGLLVVAALASLVAVPIGIAITQHLFGVEAHVSMEALATTLLVTTVAPLLAGVLLHPVLGERAERVASVIGKVAGVTLLLCGVVLLVKLAPAIWTVCGNGTMVALMVMILVGLAAGYWLAGDDPDDKAALSLAAGARHPGFAIGLTTASFPEAKLAVATIVLFLVLNALISIPYLRRLSSRPHA